MRVNWHASFAALRSVFFVRVPTKLIIPALEVAFAHLILAPDLAACRLIRPVLDYSAVKPSITLIIVVAVFVFVQSRAVVFSHVAQTGLALVSSGAVSTWKQVLVKPLHVLTPSFYFFAFILGIVVSCKKY